MEGARLLSQAGEGIAAAFCIVGVPSRMGGWRGLRKPLISSHARTPGSIVPARADDGFHAAIEPPQKAHQSIDRKSVQPEVHERRDFLRQDAERHRALGLLQLPRPDDLVDLDRKTRLRLTILRVRRAERGKTLLVPFSRCPSPRRLRSRVVGVACFRTSRATPKTRRSRTVRAPVSVADRAT